MFFVNNLNGNILHIKKMHNITERVESFFKEKLKNAIVNK